MFGRKERKEEGKVERNRGGWGGGSFQKERREERGKG